MVGFFCLFLTLLASKSALMFLYQKELTVKQLKKIFLLWNNEYPISFHFDRWENLKNYFNAYDDLHHILYVNGNSIEGWWCDFNRDNERWFTILVSSSFQKKGIRRSLVERGKESSECINGWVIEAIKLPKKGGNLYRSPLSFYLKMGFEKTSTYSKTNSGIKTVKIQWKSKRSIH